MPAHRAGGSAFLGRVQKLDKLDVNRLIGVLGQIQRRLLRELLQLPLAQSRQCQRAQERRGRTPGRKQVPPPETPRPNRKIMLAMAQGPDIPHQESFKVHGKQVLCSLASALHWL
jgi:hypothetical protein